MKHVSTAGLGLFLLTLTAAVPVRAEQPPDRQPPNADLPKAVAPRPAPAKPEATASGVRLNRPFLDVIRLHGAPSSVKTVRLIAIAPGLKDTEGIMWIYVRPDGSQLEFIIGDDGKVLQATTRSKTIQQFNVEPAR
jgi:hypothetical protein